MASAFEVARDLIDQAHKRDPLYVSPSPSGGASKQHELAYAHAMEAWVRKLLPGLKGSQAFIELQQQVQTDDQGLEQLLILAARCQHLERFLTPRSSFPDGKAGYLKWRRQLYTTQADRAVQLLTQAGLDEKQADYVHKWVSKTDLKPGKNDGDLGTQVSRTAVLKSRSMSDLGGHACSCLRTLLFSCSSRMNWLSLPLNTKSTLSKSGSTLSKSESLFSLTDIITIIIITSPTHRSICLPTERGANSHPLARKRPRSSVWQMDFLS